MLDVERLLSLPAAAGESFRSWTFFTSMLFNFSTLH
jgi:hypothetical protein